MWNLKRKTKYMNEPNTNKFIHTENKFMIVRWEAGWGMGEKGKGIKKYKFPVTKTGTGMERTA